MTVLISILIILTSLKYIHTSGCERVGDSLTCTDITLTNKTDIPVNNVRSLKTIIFINSNVPLISSGMFTRFVDVTEVRLVNNQIQTIEPGAFNGMPHLRFLYVSRNNISSLQSATINSLSNLENFVCIGNRLHKIDGNYFTNMKHLQNLAVDSNVIESLSSDAFKGLTSLTNLDLHNNSLEYLPVGCFKDLRALNKLHLQNNFIVNIEYGSFTGLHSLTGLDMRSNNLTVINEGCFLALLQLETLDISNNTIAHLNANNLISALPRLKQIWLNYNVWSCTSLSDMLFVLGKQRIALRDNSTTLETNIRGVSCKTEFSTGPTSDLEQTEDLEKFKERCDNFIVKIMIGIGIVILVLLIVIIVQLYRLFLIQNRSKYDNYVTYTDIEQHVTDS